MQTVSSTAPIALCLCLLYLTSATESDRNRGLPERYLMQFRMSLTFEANGLMGRHEISKDETLTPASGPEMQRM